MIYFKSAEIIKEYSDLYSLRYRVYCTENHCFDSENYPDQKEKDSFDAFATHFIAVDPNKQIIGEVIHNYTSNKKLDITVGVSYDSDVEKAISVVKGVVEREDRISKKPEPKIGVSEFADSSINIYSRLWCKQKDYWDVMFAINRRIHEEFKKNNITIPFPQRDIHVYDRSKTTHSDKEVFT